MIAVNGVYDSGYRGSFFQKRVAWKKNITASRFKITKSYIYIFKEDSRTKVQLVMISKLYYRIRNNRLQPWNNGKERYTRHWQGRVVALS